MVRVRMLSDKWLSRYRLLEIFIKEIILFSDILDFDLYIVAPSPGMDAGGRCHGMEANLTGYLWSKYECFLIGGC